MSDIIQGNWKMSTTKNFFRASAEDFKKIPGAPVAYWLGEKWFELFDGATDIGTVARAAKGLVTANNELFVRLWYETDFGKVSVREVSRDAAKVSGKKWFAYAKGGPFRKWYGNTDCVVNWENDGYVIQHTMTEDGTRVRATNFNLDRIFARGIAWTVITFGKQSFRFVPGGFLFDAAAGLCQSKGSTSVFSILGYLNTPIAVNALKFLNPTINLHPGYLEAIPYKETASVDAIVNELIASSKRDWDAYETSWDFAVNPLVAEAGHPVNPVNPVEKLYATLREKWAKDCEEMRRLEMENNRIFIEAYGLQDELTPEVPWHEITLTCNPWYRYGVRSAECEVQGGEGGGRGATALPELEARLRADTVKELISYAVGCMMGRYALENEGLVLADQGCTLQDYYQKVCGVRGAPALPVRFEPDEDGIIPILDFDWFADDIVSRFRKFIEVVFGTQHYHENIAWIEEALGKDLRSYFTKDFYTDHLKRYQNRPIYWLFQSPKGAFRALVYMHRYKPDMVGGVLGYLRSLQTKVENQLDLANRTAADDTQSAAAKVRAAKEAQRYAKMQKELDEYEKNVLYPLSTERLAIDLDDGVKVNYRKFGSALRKVAALEGKGD